MILRSNQEMPQIHMSYVRMPIEVRSVPGQFGVYGSKILTALWHLDLRFTLQCCKQPVLHQRNTSILYLIKKLKEEKFIKKF